MTVILELEALRLNNQSVFSVAQDIAANRWSSAVALTILCYDTFLTLGDEVELLWPKRLSVVKTLIYLNRILAFFFVCVNSYIFSAVDRSFTNASCERILIASGVGAYVSFAMSNWILLARTTALYGNSKRFRIIISAYYFLAYIVTGVLVAKSSLMLRNQIFYSLTIRACGLVIRPHTMGFIWIGPMLFETTIFLLTIFQLYKRALQTHKETSQLLIVLYRDGVCYYFIIIFLRIFNLYSWLMFPPSRLFITFLLLWSIMCIAVTRLQLNLIKAADPIYVSNAAGRSGRGDASIFAQRHSRSMVSSNHRQSVSFSHPPSISFAPKSPTTPSSPRRQDSFLPHIPGATKSFRLSKKSNHRATVASLRDLTAKHGAAEEGRQGASSPFGGIRIDQTMTFKEDRWSHRPRSGRLKGSKGSKGEIIGEGWEVVTMQDLPRKPNPSHDLRAIGLHMAETRPSSVIP
ncbi:hypothetical protein CPB86DRAFT_135380 [Serendipita vermifera]|nr:hypothetical protein CPB86DRAFT_135380 [Serendipita vermifera]